MTDAAHRQAAVDGGIRHVRAYTRRENSEDSIEVLSDIFPDDLTSITEEEAEQHLLSSSMEQEEDAQSVHRERRPDAAEPRNHSGSHRLDSHGPPGPASANGDVMKVEPVVTPVKSSQVEEDQRTRMSKIWRGSNN